MAETPVAVWVAALDGPAEAVRAAAEWLSADERQRAARFVFEHDRARFTLARAALRGILGRRLGLPPPGVRFAYSPAGKPALAGELSRAVSFNLSHSGELAVVAVAPGAAVGVDLELRRPLPDLAGIARRFFAPGETERLLALPAEEQEAAFYRCWTRKEAFLKGRGDGIVAGLDRFEVAFLAGEPARLVRTLDNPDEASQWTLTDLAVAGGYAGAVAVQAAAARVEVVPWDGGAY